jgi:hypothetical protein
VENAEKDVVATNDMVGTVAWCGTYGGLPALLLSHYGGACLWQFDVCWSKLYESTSHCESPGDFMSQIPNRGEPNTGAPQ